MSRKHDHLESIHFTTIGVDPNFCPSVHQHFLLSPTEVSELWRSFQQAKCVVSSRNEIDCNQRAYNYIAAVLATHADNSQPSYLPVLQYDYISLSPCPKPVSLSVCLHLTPPLCCFLLFCYLPSCLFPYSFHCAFFFKSLPNKHWITCVFAYLSNTMLARRDKEYGSLGVAS